MKIRTFNFSFIALLGMVLSVTLMVVGCQDTNEIITHEEIITEETVVHSPKFEDKTPTFTTSGARLGTVRK